MSLSRIFVNSYVLMDDFKGTDDGTVGDVR